jgi:hypothetical protein
MVINLGLGQPNISEISEGGTIEWNTPFLDDVTAFPVG